MTSVRPTPRPPARPVVAVLAASALVVALTVGATAAPTAAEGGDVSSYVGHINALRASRGLAPLQVDGNLGALATDWAHHLAAVGSLRHASDLSIGVDRHWVKLGENVGLGPDTGTIFAAFVASPSHYRNLVDPAFTHVGVGVVWSGGTQYTVHRFLATGGSPPPTSIGEPVPQVRTVPDVAPPPEPEPAPPSTEETGPDPEPAPAPADAPRPNEASERFAAVALALARA
jgi:uncharacterized protein YkwD